MKVAVEAVINVDKMMDDDGWIWRRWNGAI